MSSAKLQGGASGTGSVTLLAPNTNNTDVLTLPDVAADTLVGAAATQTLTNKTLGSGLVAGASYLTSGTAVASTSGTSIDFTSIPSWVKRITVMFQGVSTSGTSTIQIQLGTGASPTYTTSGYLGNSQAINSGSSSIGENNGAGFRLVANISATSVQHGQIIISNISSNSWTEFGILGQSDAARINWSGGSVSLAAVLTAVRITTVNGTDTFDAGSINILYE